MANYKIPTTEELMSAGVHFGHQVRRWNPKMEPYIFTVKKNIHIIDLTQTEELLKVAANVLYETAKTGGQIVFVGTKRQVRELLELEAKRCGALYVTERWLGGTITNYSVIKKNIDKLVDLSKKRASGELQKYTKKERLLIDRQIAKLQKSVGGLVGLRGTPAALFVVDARREKTAINEAFKHKVPIVAFTDTDSDPTRVSHVIPCNDDAMKSLVLLLKPIADAVECGYKEFSAKKEKESGKNLVASAGPESTEAIEK